MKSQSQIIQFVLFFLISISIFSLISSYLFSFSQSSQDRLLSSFREMLSSHISGYIVYSFVGCKYCNYSILKFGIPYQVFDNYHEIQTSNNQIYLKSVPNQKQVLVSTHNINSTLSSIVGFYSTGSTPSLYGLNKTSIVVISFNRTENKLKIGG
jgi:hypothetical protein